MMLDPDLEDRLVLWKARTQAADEHLRECPSLAVAQAYVIERDEDGSSVELTGQLSCEHQHSEAFTWSDWTDTEQLVDELASDEREAASANPPLTDHIEGELRRQFTEFIDDQFSIAPTHGIETEDTTELELDDAESDARSEDNPVEVDPTQPHIAHNVGIDPSSVHLVVGQPEVGLPCPVCKGNYLTVLPIHHVSNVGSSTWGMVARCVRCDPVLAEVEQPVLGTVVGL